MRECLRVFIAKHLDKNAFVSSGTLFEIVTVLYCMVAVYIGYSIDSLIVRLGEYLHMLCCGWVITCIFHLFSVLPVSQFSDVDPTSAIPFHLKTVFEVFFLTKM